jgi:hypothetical protein
MLVTDRPLPLMVPHPAGSPIDPLAIPMFGGSYSPLQQGGAAARPAAGRAQAAAGASGAQRTRLRGAERRQVSDDGEDEEAYEPDDSSDEDWDWKAAKVRRLPARDRGWCVPAHCHAPEPPAPPGATSPPPPPASPAAGSQAPGRQAEA